MYRRLANAALIAGLVYGCQGKERGPVFVSPVTTPEKFVFEPTPTLSSEIVNLPASLEMPYGNNFTVEAEASSLSLRLNVTLTQKLLDETVKKPTVPIEVHVYPSDWLRLLPEEKQIEHVSNELYESLPEGERQKFDEARTHTRYDKAGTPFEVDVYIAAGRFLQAASQGSTLTILNEFLPPEGVKLDPIVALNAVFYHEIVGHALLRNIDYRNLPAEGDLWEEKEAQRQEANWIEKNRTAVSVAELYLTP